jgi:predicted ArsR family transcriptional regulator
MGRMKRGDRSRRTAFRTGNTQRHILRLLCFGRQTVAELAAQSRLTGNAIRAHLRKLHRVGLVQAAGVRPGIRRPHVEYEITPRGRETFPTAYRPLLKALVDVLTERLTPAEALAFLSESGARLLNRFVRDGARRTPRSRAADLIREFDGYGAAVEIDAARDKLVIRSCSCPLASLTATHPEICRLAAEAVGAAIGTRMRETCERGEFPRCAFESIKRGGGD